MTDRRIAEIGNKLMPIVMSLREFGIIRFLELRFYKKNTVTQELTPTNMAVGIDSRAYSELKITLQESDEYIQNWFGSREVDTVETVRIDMAGQGRANEVAKRKAHKIELRRTAWSGPEFFKSRSEGERVVIELNATHPMTSQALAGRNVSEWSSAGAPAAIGSVLAAYHDAKSRFIGPEYAFADRIFSALEYEWGMILRSYAEVGH